MVVPSRKLERFLQKAQPQALRGLLISSLLASTLQQHTKHQNEKSHFSVFPENRRELLSLFQDLNTFFNTKLFPQKIIVQNTLFDQSFSQLQKLLDECPGCLSTSFLMQLSEHLGDSDESFRKGVFYTPPEIARSIIEKCIENSLKSHSQNITILDPACGSGIFLVQAFHILVNNRFPAEHALFSLYGIDQNPQSIELSQIFLLTEFLKYTGKKSLHKTLLKNFSKNFHIGNSLLFDTAEQKNLFPRKEQNTFCEEAFPKIFSAGGFSFVIGNPPYGLKRGARISTRENKLFQKMYADYSSGKLNLYMLFMARALQLVQDQGSIALLVPNSWLGIRSAKNLREKLLKNHCLQEITCYQFPVFQDPSLEVVSYLVRKNKTTETIKIIHKSSSTQNSYTCAVPIHTCLNRPDFTIPLVYSPDIDKVLNTIHTHSLPLKSPDSLFSPFIALQAYATGKGSPKQTKEDVKNHIYHVSEKIDSDCIPYLEGADLGLFHINWSGSYLRYGPWLAEHQPKERYTQPRILIREILAPPPRCFQITFTDQPFTYNRSILHILTQDPSHPETLRRLYALSGILSSSSGSFLILMQGKKSQRKLFPKVVNDDLKNFPLPEDFDQKTSKISPFIENLFKTQSSDEVRQIQKEIDSVVFESYGLEKKEQRTILQTLKDVTVRVF